MIRMPMFAFVLATAAPLAAQQRQVTAEDYARAERFLGANTSPLVSGVAGPPEWLSDGRFWYRTTTQGGAEFVIVDAARRTRTSAFDHTRLAAALSAATGGRIDAARLPFQRVEYSKDARGITITAADRRWTCNLQDYTCAPADTARAADGSYAAPPQLTPPPGHGLTIVPCSLGGV